MARVVFITGGARSGKSSFALKEASKIKGKKAFIATLQPLDEEMKARVQRHKAERSTEWNTFEEPLDLKKLLGQLNDYSVVLIDCLTLWLSNLMLKGRDIDLEIEELISALNSKRENLWVFVVSNEVGMGIVPENKMARQFRDVAGMLNQKMAQIADEVYFLVSGMPLKIK
jgi:adenosylcobinamide kinase/adenosylcobinamide-phosphate guanylyltransferase